MLTVFCSDDKLLLLKYIGSNLTHSVCKGRGEVVTQVVTGIFLKSGIENSK